MDMGWYSRMTYSSDEWLKQQIYIYIYIHTYTCIYIYTYIYIYIYIYICISILKLHNMWTWYALTVFIIYSFTIRGVSYDRRAAKWGNQLLDFWWENLLSSNKINIILPSSTLSRVGGKFTKRWVQILESYGKFPMHLADAKWDGVSFFPGFCEWPWLRALCGCMVSCFSHFPQAGKHRASTTFFFSRHPKDICFRPRQSWDVLGCDGGFHLSKLSKRLWGSKIFELLFYGCGSDKKSQNGSQWLDWDVEPPCLHLYLYISIYFMYVEYVSN